MLLVVEISKTRIWNLQSLLVCSIILWRIPSIGVTELLADGPDWHLWSWTGVWFSFFPAGDEWIGSDIWELHGFNSCRWGAEEDAAGFAKTFPDIPCVSQMLGGPSLRLGIPKERLSIPLGVGRGVKDTGWLVTWECPLRTDSASSTYLASSIQLIWFCNSCILPVSLRTVSRPSTNLLLAIVSNVEPWNRFNSFISLRLFSWASRRSQFCFNNCSWRSWWSCRRRSPAWARRSSSFCDSIISFNFWILLLSYSAWNSCFRISASQSARICSLCRSKRVLI